MDGEAVLIASQVAINIAAWPLVAALVVSFLRSPRPVARAFPIAATIALLIATITASNSPDPLPAANVWWLALPPLLATYPDGRIVPRWFVVPVALYLVYAVANMLMGGALAERWGALVGFSQLLLLGGAVYRYVRRSTTAERERVRWAILGTLLCVEGYVVIHVVEGGTVAEHGPVSIAAANFAAVVLPVGFALGLLYPRAIDVDRVLRAVLVVTFTAPPLAAVFGLVMATVPLEPEARGWLGAAAVTALVVPLSTLARGFADRVVFRGRLGESAAAAAVDAALSAVADAREVPHVALATIRSSLGLAGVELRAATILVARVGDVGEVTVEYPLVYQNEVLAVLAVSPRPGESSLTRHDDVVLRRLVAHVAPALHGARTLIELQEAHSATLRAREEERRRLRRDLHDDLSPTLTGLALGAAALARRAQGSAEQFSHTADELLSDIQGAVAQVREIAYDLRPPVLDDHGLVEAIRQRVHATSADSLAITVDAVGVPVELPAAVDLAALRIVQTAVDNVRKHASAMTCTVTIRVTAGSLRLMVTDDGSGLLHGATSGLGLASIRQRARELGGTADIRGDSSGTRVLVTLPLEAVR